MTGRDRRSGFQKEGYHFGLGGFNMFQLCDHRFIALINALGC
jgi:hypothetical protein